VLPTETRGKNRGLGSHRTAAGRGSFWVATGMSMIIGTSAVARPGCRSSSPSRPLRRRKRRRFPIAPRRRIDVRALAPGSEGGLRRRLECGGPLFARWNTETPECQARSMEARTSPAGKMLELDGDETRPAPGPRTRPLQQMQNVAGVSPGPVGDHDSGPQCTGTQEATAVRLSYAGGEVPTDGDRHPPLYGHRGIHTVAPRSRRALRRGPR
jgi:hypothetical protein